MLKKIMLSHSTSGGQGEQYTAHDINRNDCARLFQYITGQPVKQILHAVDNNILQNFPILREDVRMAEYIYVPQCDTFERQKSLPQSPACGAYHSSNFPLGVFYRYKNTTLCFDIIHINGTVFLNTIYQHILLSTGIIIKNLKVKNIYGGIKQVNDMYLQRGVKITRIHSGS